MTNALLTILCVLTAVDLALNATSVLLHRFAPKSKATQEVDVIKSDVDQAENAVAKLAGKQSGRVSMTLVALLAFLAVAACSLSMSCTAAQKKAVSNFGHCEETAAVKDLEAPIKQIGEDAATWAACVASGGSNCKGLSKDEALAILDSFGVAYGVDTVGCAITFVEQFFAKSVSGSADTGAATDLYNEWLAKHGKQASADESFREAERNFAEAEQGIDDVTARINQMRAELAAAAPCDGSALSVGVDGNLTCANGINGATAENIDPNGPLAIATSHALSGSGAPCESPNFMPTVDCGDGVMSYDGCRWACDYTLAGYTFVGPHQVVTPSHP